MTLCMVCAEVENLADRSFEIQLIKRVKQAPSLLGHDFVHKGLG